MPITVKFTGICTHLNQVGSPKHRVVLVRADNGANLNDAAIPPHIPKLHIDPDHIKSISGFPYGLDPLGPAGVWQIRGVEFRLDGVLGDRVERDLSKVPHLACESQQQPASSEEVTDNGQAACYFELHAGKLISTQEKEGAPINTELTVEAGDDPVLIATCFWNKKPAYFHLTPDAVIEIEHTGHQKGDTASDFLLHYRVFEKVPRDAKIPPGSGHRDGTPGDLSIGCSNSQYP